MTDAITGLDATATAQVCQAWRDKAEAVVDMPEPKIPQRSWKSARLDDGTTVGRFVFDPAAAAELEAALRTANCWDGPNDTRSPANRHADAVVTIIAFFNANHHSTGTPRHHPHVELHIHTGTDPLLTRCAVTTDGVLLPSSATDALLCDCVIHRVLRSGAAVLDYGRATRTVPKPLSAAVAARDTGCRFPRCTRPKAWCDAHHIRWWRNHGEHQTRQPAPALPTPPPPHPPTQLDHPPRPRHLRFPPFDGRVGYAAMPSPRR